jgi:hypothetical protein
MTIQDALAKLKGVEVIQINPEARYLVLLDSRMVSQASGAILLEWLKRNDIQFCAGWVTDVANAVRILEVS